MSLASVESVPALADAESWMTAAEKDLALMLLENDQQHLFAEWALGADEDAKHAFFEQVRLLQAGYPGQFRRLPSSSPALGGCKSMCPIPLPDTSM